MLVSKCLFAGIAAGVSVPILMGRLGALCVFLGDGISRSPVLFFFNEVVRFLSWKNT